MDTAEAKPVPKEKKESAVTNCAVCNKAFKHKLWYYRNGKFFCNKRCWKKYSDEKKKADAEKTAKQAQENAPKENPAS